MSAGVTDSLKMLQVIHRVLRRVSMKRIFLHQINETSLDLKVSSLNGRWANPRTIGIECIWCIIMCKRHPRHAIVSSLLSCSYTSLLIITSIVAFSFIYRNWILRVVLKLVFLVFSHFNLFSGLKSFLFHLSL